MSARERILARVRDALAERGRVPYPGGFTGERPEPPPPDPVDAFTRAFLDAGGEVLRVAADDDARAALARLAQGARGVSVGATVPAALVPDLPREAPEVAEVGISAAVGAVAETGSLLLDARDGRRTQLLPPTHLVLVRAGAVHATLSGALAGLRADLPSALGLHSGPSKSADIGQVLVRGVHGPGRVVAVIIAG